MGLHHPDFPSVMLTLLQAHVPSITAQAMTATLSKKGNYIGLTFTFTATSKAQLDAIYLALTGHPMVKIVY
jgi:putative lipoic acid-binding regulatory protein